jgi:hypothetical protein
MGQRLARLQLMLGGDEQGVLGRSRECVCEHALRCSLLPTDAQKPGVQGCTTHCV